MHTSIHIFFGITLIRRTWVLHVCVLSSEVACWLLQPECSKMVGEHAHVLFYPFFLGKSLRFATQQYWKLRMHIHTFQRKALLKDALHFLSDLSGSAHLLLDVFDFRVW